MKNSEASHALLAEGLNGIEASLLSNLLEAEGIPSLVKGPDFDVIELGELPHGMLRGANLYVPQAALERARAVLAAADWNPPQESAG